MAGLDHDKFLCPGLCCWVQWEQDLLSQLLLHDSRGCTTGKSILLYICVLCKCDIILLLQSVSMVQYLDRKNYRWLLIIIIILVVDPTRLWWILLLAYCG